jgi:hypothetical protein
MDIGDKAKPKTAGLFNGIGETSGWELALVTAESNNTGHLAESTLVCII